MTSKDKPAADDGSGTAQTEPAAVTANKQDSAPDQAPDQPHDGAPDQAPAAEHPADAKSAFAAVMARKQQAAQSRTAHLDGHGSVGGATANHKATRTFRRKSG